MSTAEKTLKEGSEKLLFVLNNFSDWAKQNNFKYLVKDLTTYITDKVKLSKVLNYKEVSNEEK